MKEIKGRGIIPGRVRGKALVTSQPLNLTSGLSKPLNLFNRLAGVYYDRHHELYKKDLYNRILVFPQTIGSTFTGMIILETIRRGRGPLAMIVQEADPLLTSGVILAEVWLEHKVPLIEIPDPDVFTLIRTDDIVEVDGELGTARIID
jgi:predicted aconitase with swiveling domain